MRNRPTLTSADVQRMMAASKAEAAKNNWIVSIAIVDDGGYLLHLERMEGAGPMTAEVAAGKARTASVTRRPTKYWDDRVKDRPGFLKFPNNLSMQGGVPIVYRGECVGAVGVSGVMSAEDDQIANAGIAALEAA